MKYPVIQQGQTFGDWTVLETPISNKHKALCRCKCGTERHVTAICIADGRSRSCGCKTKEMIATTLLKNDLGGKRFGRLIAIKIHKLRGQVNGHGQGTEWECLCDCGNTVYVVRGNLTGKVATRSCGCLAREVQRNCHTIHGEANTKAYNLHIQRKREAAKKQRIPPWSDLTKIRQTYRDCPEGMTVDHIIPLHGKMVSGLHVPNNLQYLPPGDNYRKSIKFQTRFEVKGETPKWFDEMGIGL